MPFASPAPKTAVLFTVDTEADLHLGQIIPFDRMVYCRIGREEFGIRKMMELAERHQAVMTFFTSVFEHRRLGLAPVRDICQEIHSRGHEVQLHTHPNWIHDHRFMWGYTLEEQIKLICEGRDVIRDCIGKNPIAHRAGGFGADENTLRALAANDIAIDSTYLQGGYSRLPANQLAPNGLSHLHGVLEIPVTAFKQFRLGRFHPIRPFDINANSLSELIFVLEYAKRQRMPVVNLLLHSFSFVTRSADRQQISPNPEDLEKFERLLQHIKEDDALEVIGIEQFYTRLHAQSLTLPYQPEIPVSGLHRTIARACRHPLKGKANMAIAGSITLAIVCAILALFGLYRVL